MRTTLLHKVTFGAFCLLTLDYVVRFFLSLLKHGVPDPLTFFSVASMATESNPTSMLLFLTAVALWLRSGMALWIHLAMMFSGFFEKMITFHSTAPGKYNLSVVASLVLEFVLLLLLFLLWKRREIVMRPV